MASELIQLVYGEQVLKLAGRGLAGLGRAAGIFEKEAHLARAAARVTGSQQVL